MAGLNLLSIIESKMCEVEDGAIERGGGAKISGGKELDEVPCIVLIETGINGGLVFPSGNNMSQNFLQNNII